MEYNFSVYVFNLHGNKIQFRSKRKRNLLKSEISSECKSFQIDDMLMETKKIVQWTAHHALRIYKGHEMKTKLFYRVIRVDKMVFFHLC